MSQLLAYLNRNWESGLKRIEAVAAALGLLLVVLTMTPGAASALGGWYWLALAIGFVLLVANSVAFLWGPIRGSLLWLWARSPLDVSVTRRSKVPKEPDKTERGFLDYELGFMRGLNSANRILNRITKETLRNTKSTNTSTERIKSLVGKPVERRIAGAKKSADAFDAYAKRMESLETDYRAACQEMTTNFLDWIRTAPDGNDFKSLDPTLSGLADVTRGSKASTDRYGNTVRESRRLKVSQDVNRSLDRVIAVNGRLVDDIDGIIKFCGDARAAIKERTKARRSPAEGPSTSNKADSRRSPA